MLLALPMMAQNHQSQVIDKVVAVVGKNIILQSDIENQYIQYRMQGMAEGTGKEVRGRILEDLLLQKLMLNQAEMDSITVTDEQVEAELNRRIQWFIARIGSQEKMEAQFGKSMSEIKDEVRQASKDNMLQEQVQAKIMENVVVTPKEVKEFYRDIPRDSLPMIDSDYELVQIVKRPPVSIDEKLMVKDRLYQIRKRILDGESSFATMAETGAYNTKEGEISMPVRSDFGYHLIKVQSKTDAMGNIQAAHIFLQLPYGASEEDEAAMQQKANNIYNELKAKDGKNWSEMVKQHSDDRGTVGRDGALSSFTVSRIVPEFIEACKSLEIGEIAKPVRTMYGYAVFLPPVL